MSKLPFRFARNIAADQIDVKILSGKGELKNIEINEVVLTEVIEELFCYFTLFINVIKLLEFLIVRRISHFHYFLLRCWSYRHGFVSEKLFATEWRLECRGRD